MKTDDNKEGTKESLSSIYGPLIGGKHLIHVLGYKKPATFRRALRLKALGLNTFSIEGRRGQFSFSTDVDEWLKNLNTENK